MNSFEKAFAELDKDGSGYIDFPEYLRWRQEGCKQHAAVDVSACEGLCLPPGNAT